MFFPSLFIKKIKPTGSATPARKPSGAVALRGREAGPDQVVRGRRDGRDTLAEKLKIH